MENVEDVMVHLPVAADEFSLHDAVRRLLKTHYEAGYTAEHAGTRTAMLLRQIALSWGVAVPAVSDG